MKDVLEALIRLFYPAHCGLCSKLLEIRETLLCLDCYVCLEEKRLPLADAYLPPLNPETWDDAWTLFPYESPVRELLTSAKFNSNPFLIKAFQPALKTFRSAVLSEFPCDLIVPVPQSYWTWVERQFNPAEKIAFFVANGKIPVETGLLKKRSRVIPQSSLGKEERLANPWGAFKMLRPERVRGKRILLVDDILTTGATAGEISCMFREAGASEIRVLTLARTFINSPPLPKEALDNEST